MRTSENRVKDVILNYNEENRTTSVLLDGELLEGQLLRSLMFAINLPFSVLNLPQYTETNVAPLLFNSIADRPFLQVRDGKGKLSSFVGLNKGWVTDEQFWTLCDRFEKGLGLQKDNKLSRFTGVELKAAYLIESGLTSIGDKSLYSSYFTITRLAEGGVSGDSSLLRLVCSNGCTVPTRFSDHVKINTIGEADKFLAKAKIQSKASLITAIDNQLFDAHGNPFMASVREFKTVSKLIDRYTDEPNQFLNREYVDRFYAEKGFTSHIQNFASGMSFFDVYNVATNAFSNVLNDSPMNDANIELGNLLFAKRDASSGIQDTQYVPMFGDLSTLRGEVDLQGGVSATPAQAEVILASPIHIPTTPTVEVEDVEVVEDSIEVVLPSGSEVTVSASKAKKELTAEQKAERNRKAQEYRAKVKAAKAAAV